MSEQTLKRRGPIGVVVDWINRRAALRLATAGLLLALLVLSVLLYTALAWIYTSIVPLRMGRPQPPAAVTRPAMPTATIPDSR